jgi:20S proteasome alpha/beta subunit
MAARTESAAIIAVDSEISSKNLHPIAGERKLVDVGDGSACAIEGFLGKGAAAELDVSEALRQWVREHPKREAEDGLG